MIRPLGRSPTRVSEAKSIWIIIGQTMAQISTAMARLTEAYSNPANQANRSGTITPSAMPPAMPMATQTDSHFSKKPIPPGAASCGVVLVMR